MSAKATFWAWEQSVKNSTQKLVLLKLCDSANDNNVCWPSQSKIASDCGLSRSAVLNNLKALEDQGFITSTDRFNEKGKTSKLYKINIRFVAQNDKPCSLELQTHVAENDINLKEESKRESVINNTAQNDLHEEAFNHFWSNMKLVKKNKKGSLSAFKKVTKDKSKSPMDWATFLINDIQNRINANQFGIDKLHPATYLNGQRWEDEITIDQPNNNYQVNGKPSLLDRLSGLDNQQDQLLIGGGNG